MLFHSDQTVGVIVRIHRETIQVLNMFGKLNECKLGAAQKRRTLTSTFALDGNQNHIRRKDIVRVTVQGYAVSYIFLLCILFYFQFVAEP